MVTIDKFASTISSIQGVVAILGQRMDGLYTPHDQIQDDAQPDFVAPRPPPLIQLTASHVPLVLHSQIEVTMPSAIVPILTVENYMSTYGYDGVALSTYESL